MSWNDERVELLKKMWSEGQSASQIAKELGNVTRNAVIGKVHRLGLSNRVGGGAGEAAEKVEAAPARPAPKAVEAASLRPSRGRRRPPAPAAGGPAAVNVPRAGRSDRAGGPAAAAAAFGQ